MSDEKQLTEEEQYAEFLSGLEGDKPAEPEKAEAAPVEPVAEPEPEQPSEPEPFPGYNVLPENIREQALAAFKERETKAAELDQRYRQQHGQLAPMQRKAAELERQNTELLRRIQEADSARQTATNQSAQTAFEKFRAEYPDEAAALEARTSPIELAQKQAHEKLQRIEQQQQTLLQEIELQKASALVMKAHPDAAEIVNDPMFEHWVNALDEEDQARAASTDARVAAKVIENFKRDRMLAELLDNNQKTPQQPPSRGKPKLDVDPTPRNRQSTVAARPSQGNAYGSEEEAYAAFAEAYEADPNAFAKARR